MRRPTGEAKSRQGGRDDGAVEKDGDGMSKGKFWIVLGYLTAQFWILAAGIGYVVSNQRAISTQIESTFPLLEEANISAYRAELCTCGERPQ